MSVFEVMGPIMVGPSSSHTAGALRLGRMVRAIAGGAPGRVEILLHGSFAQTGHGHGTRPALVAGLLGLAVDDERIRGALALAAAAGMEVHFKSADLGAVHPNTARLILRPAPMAAGESLSVTGCSTGGGNIRLTEIQGFQVDVSGRCPTLLTIHQDRPGMVASILPHLAGAGVNIAQMQVSRKQRGDLALMVVEVDDPIPDHCRENIAGLAGLKLVRTLERVI